MAVVTWTRGAVFQFGWLAGAFPTRQILSPIIYCSQQVTPGSQSLSHSFHKGFGLIVG
jgi:hypothetical protein